MGKKHLSKNWVSGCFGRIYDFITKGSYPGLIMNSSGNYGKIVCGRVQYLAVHSGYHLSMMTLVAKFTIIDTLPCPQI